MKSGCIQNSFLKVRIFGDVKRQSSAAMAVVFNSDGNQQNEIIAENKVNFVLYSRNPKKVLRNAFSNMKTMKSLLTKQLVQCVGIPECKNRTKGVQSGGIIVK